MKTQFVKSPDGHEYEAYVVTLSNGGTLCIEKDVACFFGDPETFMADEIKNAEKRIKDQS